MAIVLSAIAAAIGISSKWLLTSGELLPGIDGAYYWVQVRSILDDFTLAFNDLPLVLWLQALIAWLVGDIPLGVRIADAVLPALSALPIYMILRKSKSVFVPAIAILVVLLHPIQLYFFTGDFLKNSAAIPVVFFIGWILYNWEQAPRKKSIAYLIVSLTILGLAHFGTLLLGLMLVAIWLVIHLRKKSKRFWMYSISISAVTSGAVLAGLALLVPSRFERLVEFVSTPTSIFTNPAWEMIFGGRTDYPMIFGIITGQIGAVVLGFFAWRVRKNLSESQLSLLLASLVSTFILSSPFISMEWANRLIAMSFVPLLIAAMILWEASEKIAGKLTIGLLAAATLVASFAFSMVGVKQPILTQSQYQDLVKVTQEYKLPANSIVVARHGIEFLVAWHMHTNVLQETSYAEEDLSTYNAVFYLEGIGGMQGPGEMTNGQMPSKPPIGVTPPNGAAPGQKPPTGSGPGSNMRPEAPGMSGKPGGLGDDMKMVQITGEQVYKNDSFTLKQVR